MAILKNLYIVGAGGFGRETAWLAERINRKAPVWDLKGFIDDDVTLHGTMRDGYPVVGGCECLASLPGDIWVSCAVGVPKIRKIVVEKLKRYSNVKFATLIDPDVFLSNHVEIGEGSIICAGTKITVDVIIGIHAIVNLNCTIGHDTKIGSFVTIYPGVHVSGNVEVGEATELGTGMQIIQGIRIGKNSIVGAGAVAIRDIPDKCTAVGSPARPIKFFD